MEWLNYLIAILFIGGSLYLLLHVGISAYRKYRGTYLVTCPENNEVAAIAVDKAHAALTATVGSTELRLKECSRWPDRGKHGCDERCLLEIESSPGDCLVRNIVTRWYEGKSCSVCHRPIGDIDWLDHQPALAGPDKKTIQWKDMPPEKLPHLFATHVPVCWYCHVAERFRLDHPEMVTDRPEHESVGIFKG